jgi:hypothetical protein
VERHQLRGMTGCDGEGSCAAFQRGDALFEHGVGRITDAGVDVAERLQPEQRGGVVSIVKNKGCRLIDRRRAGARGRVRLRAGVNGKRGETRQSFGHEVSFWVPRKGMEKIMLRADASAVKPSAAIIDN